MKLAKSFFVGTVPYVDQAVGPASGEGVVIAVEGDGNSPGITANILGTIVERLYINRKTRIRVLVPTVVLHYEPSIIYIT